MKGPLYNQRTLLEELGKQTRLPANTTVEPVYVGDMYAEWISAPNATTDRVILYLHGGAYTMGSCNTHRNLVSRISMACGARVLLPDYRLAPEHPFPAALEDATAAYRWLLRSGYLPENIAIAGDSAGGGLTLATMLSIREAGIALPAAAVCLSPWADLEFSGESIITRAKTDPWLQEDGLRPMAAHYAGSHHLRTPLISPVYANLHKLPPMLIQVGDDEILLSDATRLANRAQQDGVDVTLDIWDHMWHVWHFLAAQMPEGQRAIDDIGIFIRRHLGHQVKVAAAA